MKIELAKHLAESLVYLMTPFCERVEIAGSIRRGCTEVKDIEIVAIPRYQTRPSIGDLFNGGTESVNTLHEWAMNRAMCKVQWIKTGTEEVIPWTPKADGKYWRGLMPHTGIKLDLFLCTPENWGTIFLIRTGSAEFSAAVMAHAKASDKYYFANGRLWLNSMEVATPEEMDVFRHLGLEYVAPQDRTGYRSVKPARVVLKLLCEVEECFEVATSRLKNSGPLTGMLLCEKHSQEICERMANAALEIPEVNAALKRIADAVWNGDNESPAEQLAARKATK